MTDQRPARARLEALRPSIVADLAALSSEFDRLNADSAGSNLDDEHDPEGATVAFERAQLIAQLDRARQRLDEVDQALRRVATNEYGRCERCGQPIAHERLLAVPLARRCIDCAAG